MFVIRKTSMNSLFDTVLQLNFFPQVEGLRLSLEQE